MSRSALLFLFLLLVPPTAWAGFDYRWQIEILDAPDLSPGLATVYNGSLYFTRWLGREDCPGHKLYQASFGGEKAPELVPPFECVFKMWARADGLLLAGTTKGRPNVRWFLLGADAEWKEKAADYAPELSLEPSRNVVDGWVSEEKSLEWTRIEKRSGEFVLKHKDGRLPLVTGNRSRERKLRFPLKIGKTLIADEAVLDPERPSSVWAFSLEKDGEAEAISITGNTALSGLSGAEGGLVVSNATLGKVFWYGQPTPGLVTNWKLKRHQIRHTPVLPWRESENNAEFWKVLGKGERK